MDSPNQKWRYAPDGSLRLARGALGLGARVLDAWVDDDQRPNHHTEPERRHSQQRHHQDDAWQGGGVLLFPQHGRRNQRWLVTEAGQIVSLFDQASAVLLLTVTRGGDHRVVVRPPLDKAAGDDLALQVRAIGAFGDTLAPRRLPSMLPQFQVGNLSLFVAGLSDKGMDPRAALARGVAAVPGLRRQPRVLAVA